MGWTPIVFFPAQMAIRNVKRSWHGAGEMLGGHGRSGGSLVFSAACPGVPFALIQSEARVRQRAMRAGIMPWAIFHFWRAGMLLKRKARDAS